MADQSDALRLLLGATSVALRHPKLWVTGVFAGGRMARSRWWRRSPFLPVPAEEFLHFRMVTMYGGDGSAAVDQRADDIVAWLQWCRTWRAVKS